MACRKLQSACTPARFSAFMNAASASLCVAYSGSGAALAGAETRSPLAEPVAEAVAARALCVQRLLALAVARRRVGRGRAGVARSSPICQRPPRTRGHGGDQRKRRSLRRGVAGALQHLGLLPRRRARVLVVPVAAPGGSRPCTRSRASWRGLHRRQARQVSTRSGSEDSDLGRRFQSRRLGPLRQLRLAVVIVDAPLGGAVLGPPQPHPWWQTRLGMKSVNSEDLDCGATLIRCDRVTCVLLRA